MSTDIGRGEIWTLADGRDVLVIVLHPAGRYPDTAMSVEITEPLHRTAVAMNIQQLHVASRFKDATRRGTVGPDAMSRVGAALRAVQDL
ncbi:hypothetical protein [Streptomyces sp. BH105]|uniref:hypothetical protein n=1 Tax=Streptomyces sp. BH105 TaxID=3410408 RepID=UPI003CFBBC4B